MAGIGLLRDSAFLSKATELTKLRIAPYDMVYSTLVSVRLKDFRHGRKIAIVLRFA